MSLLDHRHPYVGEGADGARRSARIDREEADGLASGDPRRDTLLASAARWEAQADELDARVERVDQYTVEVGGHRVRATVEQERALRAMDAEQRGRFLRITGGES